MTITTTDTVERYVGDGTQTAWPITFPFFKGEDVKACIVNSAGEQVNLTYGTEYTVTKSTSSIGGTLNYALADGKSLTIWLSLPITQGTDFYNTGPLNAEVLEAALDRLTLIAQQLQEASDRSVKVVTSSMETPEELLASLYTGRDTAVASASAAATSESNAATSEQAASEAASSMASSLESAVTTAVSDATALATASASAAATSEANAAASETAAANSAITAQTWAESDTPPDPDDAESKSAKTWALSAAANVPIASTTYAGKVMASASLQVNQETGEATVPVATETVAGIVARATLEEAQAGENIDKYLTPIHIADINTAIANAKATGQIGNVAATIADFDFDADSDDLASGTYLMFRLVTHPSGTTEGAGLLYHQVTVNGYTQLFVGLNPPNVLYSRVKHLGTLFGWQNLAPNAIPTDMTILSTGVGIYRHSSGQGSVIVFGGKQVLVADACHRAANKTWAAATSWCAGKTIGGLRCYMPDLDTLYVIWLNRTAIDSRDPTASNNTSKKLSNWGFGTGVVWSRLPYLLTNHAWGVNTTRAYDYDISNTHGALPCLEL